ncbi:MAG: Zn-dependent hydrolase [Cohaesibacteraceae bacterium]|nr:Zn-dependent hydrolase [Cohaesibacteraceae bacterium]
MSNTTEFIESHALPSILVEIDSINLLARLKALGAIGRNVDGELVRLAASIEDKAGRDQLVQWFEDAGLGISIDRIGNIFGTWCGDLAGQPLMLGSHIDTVINAGTLDGSYGVLAGLAVVEAMQLAKLQPDRPVIIAAFTNEEGVRYMPDMMGSLVYSGGLEISKALATIGTDGSVLGEALQQISYAGDIQPGSVIPHAFIELHVEQGPVLEVENLNIGAVANLQGISWQRISISGVANHAGTTPTHMRADAGLVAARINTFLRDEIVGKSMTTVATVGTMKLSPDAINVIPDGAIFTVDLRDPDEVVLQAVEVKLQDYLKKLQDAGNISITSERLARFEPVQFDTDLVASIEDAALKAGHSCRRMTSGAGHDAQMMARICPSAMIFVPSRDGISHNPLEHTDDTALVAGANVLLGVALDLCGCEQAGDQSAIVKET